MIGLRTVVLLGLVSWPVATLAQVAPDTVTLTGRLEIVWGDPPGADQQPVIRFYLRDDAGAVQLLQIDEATARTLGDLLGLRGKRVAVKIERSAQPGVGQRVRALEPRAEVQPGEWAAAVLAPAFAAQAAVSRPYITILCRFIDSPAITPNSKEHYEQLMGGAYPGVNHYWTEITEGQTNLNGSVVVGWYALPATRDTYLPNGSADLTRLMNDCTAAADADVFFPDFAGINLQFNQRLDCCSYGGGRTITRDGVTRFYPMTWEADWANAGTYTHEVGHSLGLPHSGGPYGRVYDSWWDVMSASSWYAVPGTTFRTGSHTNAYHKTLLGVITSERTAVATGALTTVQLERSAQPRANGKPQIVEIPISAATGEYYTLEVRGQAGYDTALPLSGVIIHHVAPRTTWNVRASVVDIDGNGSVNDAGAVWTVGETFTDARNNIAVTVDSTRDGSFGVTIRRTPIAALSLSSRAIAHSAAGGSATVIPDSTRVTVSGTAAWQASVRARRIRLLGGSGSGSAALRWQSETAGLAPGLYVDTITITAPGLVGSPALFIDSLSVTAPAELRVGVTATLRIDSVVAGRAGFVDSVRVRFTGPGATTTSWSVSSRLNRAVLSGATSGIGDGSIRWFHNATALPPGDYADTLTVVAPAAAGSPLLIVDTLRVFAAPQLTLERSGPARSVIAEGAAAPADSIAVRLSGRWASAGNWSTSFVRTPRFLRIVAGPRTGNATLAFTRSTTTLSPGIYVDSVRVFSVMAGGNNVIFTDTVEVQSAAPSFRLSWNSRRDSVALGTGQSRDSVLVIVEGPASAPREWRATALTSRITLASLDAFTAVGTGTGTQWLRWSRNLSNRVAGMGVDTIRVTLAGVPTVELIDSLQVHVSMAITAAAQSRSIVSILGRAAPDDSVRFDIVGTGSASALWTATARAPWLQLSTRSGVGSGVLRWTRSALGMGVGTYVDTIMLAVQGAIGSPVRIVDTMRLVQAIAISTSAVLRPGFMGANYADTIHVSGGGDPIVLSEVGELPAGLRLDAISGVLSGIPAVSGQFRFGVRARSGPIDTLATFTLAIAKPVLTETAVVEHVLGRAALSADHARFLDLLGNRNGRVDVGDVRAWLLDGAASAAVATAVARTASARDSATHKRRPRP